MGGAARSGREGQRRAGEASLLLSPAFASLLIFSLSKNEVNVPPLLTAYWR